MAASLDLLQFTATAATIYYCYYSYYCFMFYCYSDYSYYCYMCYCYYSYYTLLVLRCKRRKSTPHAQSRSNYATDIVARSMVSKRYPHQTGCRLMFIHAWMQRHVNISKIMYMRVRLQAFELTL